ncbi:MAG: acyl-CoA thioesterase [Hyphomicrobiaceae bacterium]
METTTLPRLEEFPFAVTQTLRFTDTDRHGHITNAVLAALCQTGRVAFLEDPAHPLAPPDTQFILARLEMDFRHELHWPGTVEIATRIGQIGRSSLTLVQALFHQQRCIAAAQSVVVLTSQSTRRPIPIPDDLKLNLQWLAAAAM